MADEEAWRETTESARLEESKRLTLSELGISREAQIPREARDAIEVASTLHHRLATLASDALLAGAYGYAQLAEPLKP